MDIGVVGPGALGTFIAAVLGKRENVVLLGRREHNIDKLQISGETEIEVEVEYTTDIADMKGLDLVVICTKSYDTKTVMDDLSNVLDEKTDILSLQNGLNNEKIVSGYIGEERTIGGITSHGLTFISPGKVLHAGTGDTPIGRYPSGVDGKVEEVKQVFDKAGIQVKTTDNIYGYIWKKVVINACINPLTAIAKVENGKLLQNTYLEGLMEKLYYEASEIAVKDADLPAGDMEDLLEETKKVARRTAKNRSSMLQDVENRKKTEIDCITGAILEVGKGYDIEAPYTQAIYGLVKGIEREYLES